MAKEEKARNRKDKHTERKTYKKTAAYLKKGPKNKSKPFSKEVFTAVDSGFMTEEDDTVIIDECFRFSVAM